MIDVGWLSPAQDCWDANTIRLLLDGDLYPHGLKVTHHEGYPNTDAPVVIIVPGRYYAQHIDQINIAIQRFASVLIVVTSDEESLFDIGKIEHSAARFWVQTPRADRDYGDARLFGVGFPPHFNRVPPPSVPRLDVFLSAQNTHARRAEAFAALTDGASRYIEATDGFTHGIPPNAYRHIMASTKVAPCPSGAYSPDTFRVYEALEAHAVPIADDISPAYPSAGYWLRVFPDCPFPILTDYTDLPGWIDDILADYPRNANRIAAWWMGQKRRMAHNLREDLTALGADMSTAAVGADITVLVSTSPIRSHPDTRIVDETIASVLHHLPRAEIILMCDGVRPEQEDRRADYEMYLQRVLWTADHRWRHTLPLVFDEHLHQAECTRRALEHVQTPLILFCEGDTPLTRDPIPWNALTTVIEAGDANLIRFSHEASILEPHKHLMLDDTPQWVRGVPLTRTVQWSQRPHLASAAFYRGMIDRYFPPGRRDFIEDRVYGRLIADYERDGDMGWLGWRTWIYTPPSDIKRSYHTDGRAGESKFV